MLSEARIIDVLATELWAAIQQLATARAATGSELQAKFLQDGAGTLSYSGLNTFFRGLEGKIGAPDPKVHEAMAREHTGRGDSLEIFTTGNYGIETTSATEWRFVAEPDGPSPTGGWPREAKIVAARFARGVARIRASEGGRGGDDASSVGMSLLDAGAQQRRPLPLPRMQWLLAERSLRLKQINEPELVLEEGLAARLYTGPLFVKYNAVLRGLDSDVLFLKMAMIRLCCPKTVADEFAQQLSGSYEKARMELNTYTTTLHAINSSIVKLSKLTVATKVYRGIGGHVLPAEFWTPNAYGVKGGIEAAFMSTTTDREVAMSYAAGDAGFVFEIQQGMIDRGADISFLSQYPHEKEILFAPLTGLEVRSTRVESSVMVVEVRLSVNLLALTLEEVISKRRKMVLDMAAAMRTEVRDELVRKSRAHPGHTCFRSGVTPIVGLRYEHTRFETDPANEVSRMVTESLCEEEFMKLPEIGDKGVSLPGGVGYQPGKKAFRRIPPLWSGYDLGVLSWLADAATTLVHNIAMDHDADWYNDDEHFNQVVSDGLTIKQAITASATELKLNGLASIRTLPAELARHTKLQCLDLSGCENLSALPAWIGELVHLEQLKLRGCVALESLPKELSKCTALKLLAFPDDPNNGTLDRPKSALIALPDLSALPNLKFTGDLPTNLRPWDDSTNVQGRRKAYDLRDGTGVATSTIVEMQLQHIRVLREIPWVAKCHAMKKLRVQGCTRLESLPDLTACSALERLELIGVALSELPSSLMCCKRLKVLRLDGCTTIATLPANLGDGLALETLGLVGCSALTHIPPSIGHCLNLKKLDIGYCSSLTRLPSELVRCTALEQIDGYTCAGMHSYPEWIGQCKALKQLNIPMWPSWCVVLPDSLCDCAALEQVYLWNSAIVGLPSRFGQLRNLGVLKMASCSHLTSLPESIVECESLNAIDLSECVKLEMLPAELGQCTNLLHLNVEKCERLGALPNSLAECKKLKVLTFRGCVALKSVPDFASRKSLDIECDSAHEEAFPGLKEAIKAFSALQARRHAKIEEQQKARLQGEAKVRLQGEESQSHAQSESEDD